MITPFHFVIRNFKVVDFATCCPCSAAVLYFPVTTMHSAWDQRENQSKGEKATKICRFPQTQLCKCELDMGLFALCYFIPYMLLNPEQIVHKQQPMAKVLFISGRPSVDSEGPLQMEQQLIND